MVNFYEEIDTAFDKLYETYGFNDDIINLKQNILHAYENENAYRCEEIRKAITPRHWIIDKDGYVRSVESVRSVSPSK